jgi:anionic cell wall polymer biosynthesis LytR-Cps2A-Psr (LCP) family protein
MNMDAIGILNDQVGGVAVQVEDDFSAVDATIGKGYVRLNGQQAVSFLRSRQQVGDQLNLTRMKRQEIYMSAFVKELKRNLQEKDRFASDSYDKVSPYMVTDLSSSALLGLVQYYSDYDLGETYHLEGENRVEEFMEYHLDEQALEKTVLELFYERIG